MLLGDHEITMKCYVERLKLKKARIVGVNSVGMNLEAKPLRETLMNEGLATPG